VIPIVPDFASGLGTSCTGRTTRDFICFEPMTVITSAVILQHEGKYVDLQTVAPGAKWTESFRIRSSYCGSAKL
jgi:hypothetical protein